VELSGQAGPLLEGRPLHLGIAELDTDTVRQTLGVVLKNQEDISVVERLLDDDAWVAQAG